MTRVSGWWLTVWCRMTYVGRCIYKNGCGVADTAGHIGNVKFPIASGLEHYLVCEVEAYTCLEVDENDIL